ncbi:immunoglobulin domain-containing protein [Ditylenchus destructor]|uniref:Immunoglobulin domain-containing protein n=1 Tax=Ditylenchus destructor TaxID=166010 RepID=A0AAD4NEJ2_9BILA|nr:immunoglobulin domain-containing protein [Ditylenchus destructor]
MARRRRLHFSIIRLLCIICAFLLSASAANYEFRERPQNTSVLIGKDVTLKCSVPASNTEFDSLSQWRNNVGALLGYHDSGHLPGYSGRYSYVKESSEELHLKIERVTLGDDGKFECQMVRPHGTAPKFLRASAFINILVPPESVFFQHYKGGSTIEVNEETPLNVTCVGSAAKPATEINMFLSGKKVTDNIQRWTEQLENGTFKSFATLAWSPTKNDHNKLLSCEGNHRETGTNLRNSITLHVLYSSDRPKIDIIGGGEQLKAGQNLTLLCSAEGGNPPPRLFWSTQDGSIINSTYQYDFTNQITRNGYNFVVRGSDNNVAYECSSFNRENAAPLKKSITLHVDYPPSAVYLYGSTTVRKGESVVISCQTAVSSPASVIHWKVNGQGTRLQAQAEKRQAQGHVTESNITIDSITLLSGQNQITVECIATNTEGPSVSNNHIIRVLSPPSTPVIFEPERNPPLLEGNLLNLTCEAQGGHPLATLSWYRGVEKLRESHSENIGEASRSTVGIQLDRSMNQQQIKCEAESGALDEPLVTTKVLSVLFPPSHMKIHPMDAGHTSIVADAPSRLACHVPSSNPPAEISWEFESKSNRRATTKQGQYTKRNRPVGEYKGYETENVIQFIPTEEMDKSTVRCIASHSQWTEPKSTTYTLDVMYPPRISVEGPISITVGEGESFEEKFTIYANPPVNSYEWKRNGITVDGSAGAIYIRGPIIGGNGVGKEDSAEYTLKASNRIGTANVSLRLIISYPARVTYITSPVIAGQGEDVVLECEGDGYPLKHGMVKWFRGNNEMKSIVQDERRAVLRLNATHETGGAYNCVADNGVGKPNFTTAYLLVRRAPVILPGFDRAAGPIGGKATLRCRAVAVPNAEFSWAIEGNGMMISQNTSKYKFFDTQLDHSTFQSTLTILNLEELDYLYRYRCRANNRLGIIQSYVSLEKPGPPNTPTDLEVVNVTDKTVSLSWIPGFDGGSDQFFELRYRSASDLDDKSVNSSGSRVQIGDLESEQTYRVQIRAINMRGRLSEFSSPVLQFRTLDKNMQGVYKVATESGSLTKSLMIVIIAVLVLLVLINLLLLYCCKRSQNKKKMQEKTEKARTLNYGSDGSARIHIYGTMGTPGTNRRPDSTNTNKSELLNEPPLNDDSQSIRSVRTIIEVNPNGYMMNHINNPNGEFYEANCIADYDTNQDFYSPINKSMLHNGTTYAAVPHPEPPYNGSNSYVYSDIGHPYGPGYPIIESPAMQRHRMDYAYTLPMEPNTFLPSEYGHTNGCTGYGNPHQQSHSQYQTTAGNPNNNNYGTSRSLNQAIRSPKLMSTFVHQPTNSGSGNQLGVSTCDPSEGDLV